MSHAEQGFLVTGGGSGIGQQVCVMAAATGASVAIADVDLTAAESTAQMVRETNGKAFTYQLDVTDPGAVANTVTRAASDLGRLNVLVNSAGVREIDSVLDLPYEEWKRVIDVNLSGTFLVSQAFARRLRDSDEPARIVNLASTLGLMAAPNRAAYTASKHGVVGLTREMALELGSSNIRVNAVAPGVVRTPLTEQYFETEEYTQVVNRLHPVGRYATPDEIARAILFLADPANDFITGVTLPVDGGWTIGKSM